MDLVLAKDELSQFAIQKPGSNVRIQFETDTWKGIGLLHPFNPRTVLKITYITNFLGSVWTPMLMDFHEYITYLATDNTLLRTIKDAIFLQAMWNSFERQSVKLLCHNGYITCTDPV